MGPFVRVRENGINVRKAHLLRNGQPLVGEEEDFIDCIYKIEWDLGHVCFHHGWTDFASAAHIGVDSTVLIKIYTMQEYIGLKSSTSGGN